MYTHIYIHIHLCVSVCVRRWVYVYLVDHDINIFFIVGHCEKDLKDPAKQDIIAFGLKIPMHLEKCNPHWG